MCHVCKVKKEGTNVWERVFLPACVQFSLYTVKRIDRQKGTTYDDSKQDSPGLSGQQSDEPA